MLTIKSSAKKAKKIGEEFKINCDGFTSCAALYAYLADNYSHLLEVCVTAVYGTAGREKWHGFKLSRLSVLKQLLRLEYKMWIHSTVCRGCPVTLIE